MVGIAEFNSPSVHNEFVVLRYNGSDGTLDTDFDGDGTPGNGIVTTQMAASGFDAEARAVTISGGKIVVAGPASNGTDNDFGVARYSGTDGKLDTGFSTDGKQTTDFGPGNDTATGVAVQGTNVVVGGFASNGTNLDFALARFDSGGTLDATFDGDSGTGNGKVTTAVSISDDVANALALEPDGKIVLAGRAETGTVTGVDIALARYNGTDGTLDTSFDGNSGTGNGKFTTPLFGSIGGLDEANGLAVQSDGKLVVAGETSPTGNSSGADFAVLRYSGVDGTLDTSFDQDGKNTQAAAPGAGADFAHDVALQPDGKVVAAGEAANGATTGTDFALIRYQGDPVTVNDKRDLSDLDTTDAICDGDAAGGSQCTLRAAIQQTSSGARR